MGLALIIWLIKCVASRLKLMINNKGKVMEAAGRIGLIYSVFACEFTVEFSHLEFCCLFHQNLLYWKLEL